MVRHDMARPSATRRRVSLHAGARAATSARQRRAGRRANAGADLLVDTPTTAATGRSAACGPATGDLERALRGSDTSDRHHRSSRSWPPSAACSGSSARSRSCSSDRSPGSRPGAPGLPGLPESSAQSRSSFPSPTSSSHGARGASSRGRGRSASSSRPSRSSSGCSSCLAATSARSSASRSPAAITYYLFQPDIQRAFGRHDLISGTHRDDRAGRATCRPFAVRELGRHGKVGEGRQRP